MKDLRSLDFHSIIEVNFYAAFAFFAAFYMVLLSHFYQANFQPDPLPQVLGEVTVSTQAYGCLLNPLTVVPEARAVNNYATDIAVDVTSAGSSTVLGSFSGTTSNFGELFLNICEITSPVYLSNSNYDFYVTGKSHLRKQFANVNGITRAANTVDLSTGGEVLLAGDVNNIKDEEINSLDVSNIIRYYNLTTVSPFYQDTYDLDFDGSIDIDDMNVLVGNIYAIGD